MSIQALIRWGGLALCLGGIFGVVGTLVQPMSTLTSATLDYWWTPSSNIDIVGNLLILIGLVGLYLRLIDKAGVLGFIAFVLSVVTTVLATVSTAIAGYVFPYIALQPDAPQYFTEIIAPGGPLASLIPLGQALTIADVGFMLLGVVIIRTGVLSRWAGWLLLITTILGDVFPFPAEPILLTAAGQIAWCLVLVWLGFILFRPPVEVVELQPATERR